MNDQDKNIQMARLLARRVQEAGGRCYYVGGCVRDHLMGRESKDIDLEIHGITPQCLQGILEELGSPKTMGSSFGIWSLRGYGLDIAMPRADSAGHGQKDFFSCVDPFIGTREAALRRDLTMNALMQDVLSGEIVDHFGGAEDIKKGLIRHVSDASFAEDPLRVIRVAQFASRFGFAVAEETLELCSHLELGQLPPERVWGELEKALIKSARPSIFFETLRRMGKLSPWFSELEKLIGLEQDPVFHPEGDVWNHTMLVLDAAAALRGSAEYPLGFMVSALCHDLGKLTTSELVDGRIHSYGHETEGVPIARNLLSRLTREAKLHSYVSNMIRLHMQPNQKAAQHAGTKAMCKMFDQASSPADLLLLAKADHCSRPDVSPYEETEAFLRSALELFRERMARPHVMGADLIAAGFTPGSDFSQALDYAQKLRLSGVEKEIALKQTVSYLKKLRN